MSKPVNQSSKKRSPKGFSVVVSKIGNTKRIVLKEEVVNLQPTFASATAKYEIFAVEKGKETVVLTVFLFKGSGRVQMSVLDRNMDSIQELVF